MFYVCVSEDTSILVRDVGYCCNSPCLDWSVLSDLSTQVECLDEITSFLGMWLVKYGKPVLLMLQSDSVLLERTWFNSRQL